MSDLPEAGTTRSGPLWQDDYLAPPAIPTGEKPSDVLNVIWRKNEVFIDIGSWALGSAVMVLWSGFVTAVLGIWLGWDIAAKELLIGFGIILGIPILILLYGLTKPVPPPHPLQSAAPRSLRPTEGWHLLVRTLGIGERCRYGGIVGRPAWPFDSRPVGHRLSQSALGRQVQREQGIFPGSELWWRKNCDGHVGMYPQLYGGWARCSS